MSRLAAPALDPAEVPARDTINYPDPLKPTIVGRSKKALGDPLGLTRFGVNLTTLAPGAASALRHWHTREDEFVYLLEGEVTLVTGEGRQVLRPGDAAGFPAGRVDGHHLVNTGSVPAVFLEVGNRDPEDDVHYPDDDLQKLRKGPFTRKDGSDW